MDVRNSSVRWCGVELVPWEGIVFTRSMSSHVMPNALSSHIACECGHKLVRRRSRLARAAYRLGHADAEERRLL
eukprot:2019545-Pleurochrysis_carterae.AAC.4